MKIIKTIFLALIISAVFISCNNRPEKKQELKDQNKSINTDTILVEDLYIRRGIDSNSMNLNFEAANEYSKTKSEIEQLRNSLSQKYNSLKDSLGKILFLDSISSVFSSELLNDIIPYWYGTTWNFNGYTAKPNEGSIACGYFVSTTLRDMGLNINRFKLAQQGPENEAISISIDRNSMLIINEKDLSEELPHLNSGLYFVGLDNHVGYLYKNGDELYFLHSNYIEGLVMIENIKFSRAFVSSIYYIVPISNNRILAEKWLSQHEILIVNVGGNN